LSNIPAAAISVGLPVAVYNPVFASQVEFEQFRAIERFCVEGSFMVGRESGNRTIMIPRENLGRN